MQLEQELQLMIYIGRGENMETYRITCYNIISITEAIGIENKMHKAEAYLPNIDVWENMLGYLSAADTTANHRHISFQGQPTTDT